jgi:peroxiredoxin
MLKIKILILIALIFAVSYNTFAKNPGDKVDDFTINNYDGVTYTLSEALQTNDAVVIMFWSTECPFVQPYTERINSLANEFSAKKIGFWAVNSNIEEDVNTIREHKEKNQYPFAMLKDNDNVVADLFEAVRTPEIFVIGKDMTILYHGRIDDNKNASQVTTSDLKNALTEFISGKEITVKSAQQFGCTIKRKGQ